MEQRNVDGVFSIVLAIVISFCICPTTDMQDNILVGRKEGELLDAIFLIKNTPKHDAASVMRALGTLFDGKTFASTIVRHYIPRLKTWFNGLDMNVITNETYRNRMTLLSQGVDLWIKNDSTKV